MFRLKDVMTLGNAVGGFAAMILCIEGHLTAAAVAIVVGYAFDSLDGTVARLLGGGPTKFGAELDNTCDLITYSVAPSVLFYATYVDRHGFWLAAILGSLPLLTGTVRFARFNIKRIEYPGIWFGMPRPASAMTLVCFLQGDLFRYVPYADYAGMVLVVALSVWNLGLYPFVGHHNRRWVPWVAVLLLGGVVGSVVVSIPVSFLLDVTIFWDVAFAWLVLYPLAQWTLISPEERERIRDYVRHWRTDNAAA